MPAGKSRLDRLVSANRKGGKAKAKARLSRGSSRSGTRRRLTPEELMADGKITTSPAFPATPEFPPPDPEDSIHADPQSESTQDTSVETAPETVDGGAGHDDQDQENDEALDVVESEKAEESTRVPSPQIRPDLNRLRVPTGRAAETEYDHSLPGIVSIALPAPVRDEYSAHKRANQPLREYLADRLTRCSGHYDEKFVYFREQEVRELENLTGQNFSSADDILHWLRHTTTLGLGKLRLTLEPELLERALFRKDPDQTDSECLSEYLTAGIEIKTGLR